MQLPGWQLSEIEVRFQGRKLELLLSDVELDLGLVRPLD